MPAPIPPGELADLVIDTLGLRPPHDRYNGATELATEMQWPNKAIGRIRKWRQEKSQPSYDETWDMLAKIGLLPTDRASVLEQASRVARQDFRRRQKPT